VEIQLFLQMKGFQAQICTPIVVEHGDIAVALDLTMERVANVAFG
jgi:hypothetical protein